MKKITSFFSIALLLLTALPSLYAQSGWTQKASLPAGGNARHHPITWAIDSLGYVLTGTTNASVGNNDFYEYNPATDSWRTLNNFPGPARSFSIGGVYQGEGYLGFGMTGGGVLLNDMWKYNPDTETWTQLASCPCTGRRHPSFTINAKHGKIFMGKGDNLNQNLRDWWEYDIASDTWTQRSNYPGARRHHPYHFSIGDYSYSGLGHGNGIFADLQRYDPVTDNWTSMASAPEPRVAGAQFEYDGMGFVLSGDDRFHQASIPSVFWAYLPQEDRWVTLPPHPGPSLWAPGSFVIDGVVYLVGGQDRIANQLKDQLWSFPLEIYLSNNGLDPAMNLAVYPNPVRDFLQVQGLKAGLSYQAQIMSLDGRVLREEALGESLDLRSLAPGVYILQITDSEGASQQQRLVKA